MTPSFDSTSTQPLIRARNIYLLYMIFILLLGGVLGWYFGTRYFESRTALDERFALTRTLSTDVETYRTKQEETIKSFEQNRKLLEETVFKILPADEELIALTKQLDDFFDRNYSTASPIVASNLRFGSRIQAEGQSFAALPVSMTITAPQDKFQRFLDFVENSGSFENGTRLLDLRAIRMNFADGAEAQKEVSFTVDLNAYFRKGASNGNAE